MNILIDLGNSRLKWARHAPGLWRSEAALLEGEDDMGLLLDREWNGIPAPQKVIVCSVSSAQRLRVLEQWALTHWSVTPRIVSTQPEQLGVINRYREPRQLGADRWAALIGARGLTSSASCVVDCGTAVTVDALTEKGEFLGGVIFPGLRLLRDSLARGTEGIKATESEVTDCLARSTADGVAAGTLYGLAGAVERLIDEYRRTLGATMKIFLTGGDAPQLAARLRVETIAVPDLVLTGLARMVEES